MKKIINKNMSEQLFQALFGTIAVKIPLNKAGTFAAPIRATAKVVESLLKFANKRSFNLFVFASAVSLNTLAISDALAKTGCFVESDNYVYCYNSSGVQQKLGDWSGGNSSYKVTSYTTDGDKLIVTRNDGNVVEFTYDTSANTVTNKYVSGSDTGTTNTYTFDNNGNKIARVGRPSSGIYDFTYTYDPNTGRQTSYTQTYSDGSSDAYTYDPDTGKQTSLKQTYSDGSSRVVTYDPNTGRLTSQTRTESDGSGSAYTYDPDTGRKTSEASTDANGYTRTTTYDGYGTSDSNVTGRTLTDSKGKPVNGTVTSGNNTYTAENGVWIGYTQTYSDGSSYAKTYDPNTGIQTSYTRTYSDGSGYAETYDPNTGIKTSYTETYSNGSSYTKTYDPNTGSLTSETYYDADGNPLNGFVVSEGYGWISGGCGWGCLWEDGKFITNGFHNVSGVYVRCEGNYPCPGGIYGLSSK